MKPNTTSFSFGYKTISIILISAMLNLTIGCNYYQVTGSFNNPTDFSEVSPSKYVVVHFQSESFHLANIVVDHDGQMVIGIRDSVVAAHQGHSYPKLRGNRFKRRFETPANEIHIYVNEYITDEGGTVSIPIPAISRLDVYDLQVGATVTSYALTTVGVLAGAYFLLIIIILLTKGSCPFIYIKNGEAYQFSGEIYGGAISKNLERDDYMPLPGFKSLNGKFELKMTNELLERQYTDVAELMVFEHGEDLKVLMDKNGEVHTFSDPQPPTKATSDLGTDLLPTILKNDSIIYGFLDEMRENTDFSSILIDFAKPQGSEGAKIILRLKNTLWLDYIYGKFNAQFGKGYEEFAEKQKTTPAEVKRQWAIDQGMMMAVKIKTKNGWEDLDHLNMIGPLAYRDLLIPIDLKDHSSETIELKLECGFNFWELDYIAMDFSSDVMVEPVTIKAARAVDEDGVDVQLALSEADGNYLSQLEVGNEAFLTYPAPKPKSETNQFSVFLHTRGYYEYIRDYSGKPNIKELKRFKEKGSFTRFAKEQMIQLAGLEN